MLPSNPVLEFRESLGCGKRIPNCDTDCSYLIPSARDVFESSLCLLFASSALVLVVVDSLWKIKLHSILQEFSLRQLSTISVSETYCGGTGSAYDLADSSKLERSMPRFVHRQRKAGSSANR